MKDTKKQKSIVEKDKQKAEGDLRELKAAHNTTKQKLADEKKAHKNTKQKLNEVNRKLQSTEDKQFQPPRKPADPQVQAKLDAYREKFDAAKSGNGRKRPFLVEEDKDWFVTLWVGEVRGKLRACVFAPWKSSDSGWIKAGEEPLIDQRCNSEEEAFEHLWRVEQSGEIKRHALKAIKDYEDPDDSDDDSDDDIPF